MKTVIIDNSLCTLPIAEGTSPELICRYRDRREVR